MSSSVENFIKIAYHLALKNHGFVKPGEIAKNLKISNAAATDMAKKLASRNYLVYEKYQALSLTEKGRKKAIEVLRKHRLWELFLYQTLGFNLSQIHKEAELLEHQTSEFLANSISEYLNHPEFDPHGDPIPDIMGELPDLKEMISLFDAEEGRMYVIKRLRGAVDEFFDVCHEYNLVLNERIFIRKKYIKTKMIEIERNKERILLNEELAANIDVKPEEVN